MYGETLKTGEMVKHTVCCRIAMKLEKVGRNIAATQRVFHRGGDGSKELVWLSSGFRWSACVVWSSCKVVIMVWRWGLSLYNIIIEISEKRWKQSWEAWRGSQAAKRQKWYHIISCSICHKIWRVVGAVSFWQAGEEPGSSEAKVPRVPEMQASANPGHTGAVIST